MAEAIYLAVVLAAALVLFYKGWIRPDVTALLVLLSLIVPWRPEDGRLVALLEPEDAFRGFGSPAVILVASMFVLSAAMARTGAAQILGERILAIGSRSEALFQMTILGLVTIFSAFVNDTTTVLLWMPMVLTLCHRRGYSPSRVLLLLAYASLLGGQWTLIGTRSNLILSDYLRSRTGEGLAFFSFTPIAVVVWLLSLAYVHLLGRRLLPHGAALESLAARYDVTEYLTEVLVSPESSLEGKTLGELDLGERFGVNVLKVVREERHIHATPWLRILPGDVLVVQGRISNITDLVKRTEFQILEELQIGEKTLKSVDLVMVEALLAPGSRFEGTTVEEIDLQDSYGMRVLAVGRHGRPLTDRPLTERLRFGDSLLLLGHEEDVARLRRNPNLILLESGSLPVTGRKRAIGALLLLAFVVVASATGLLSPLIVIPAAAIVAIVTRLVGMREAYQSLDLKALVIVAAMIPYGFALEGTGTAHAAAEWIATNFEGYGPHLILAGLLLVTVFLTQLIENAAVAVVMSPIAYHMALSSGAAPMPFLLAVAICTSSAFMSPIAHESTILVMSPGRYTFRDYLKVGTPLAFLTWIVTTILVPIVYPLR